MEIDFLVFGGAAIWGGLLGAVFFGGLWWSLKGISQRQRPRLFLGGSFVVRTLIALAGFWIALGYGVTIFLISICTFTVVRFILTQSLGVKKGEPGHAN